MKEIGFRLYRLSILSHVFNEYKKILYIVDLDCCHNNPRTEHRMRMFPEPNSLMNQRKFCHNL